jgi:hypothetical protein
MRRRLSGPFVLIAIAALLPATSFLISCSGMSGANGAAKVTPAITWPPPAPIAARTPLGTAQLDATATVPGTFVYNPSAGTMLTSGTQTLSVSFIPANTAAYNSVSASVPITVDQTNSTSAFVYASSSPSSNNIEVFAYSAASDGTLTPVAGSPFSSPVSLEASNGKFLFGTNGVDITSFSVVADGTIQQVSSIDAQQFNGKTLSGSPCGGPTNLVLDRPGANLYDLDVYSDCANNAYQSFNVDSSTGGLTYLGVTSTTTPIFEVPLTFLGSNLFAYGASCYHWLQEIYGLARNNDGTLTALPLSPGIDPAMPASASGQIYCPYLAAADASNHVAVPVQPVDNSSLQPVGPYQLALYTADNAGNLTTTSSNLNMLTASVTSGSSNSLTAISLSPSGNLLAVAGAGGLQVFHFNGASPITAYTGPLTTVPVDQLSWDNANHLYAISQSKGQLFVFTVSPSTNSAVSGSPYSVANPANLVVVSQ